MAHFKIVILIFCATFGSFTDSAGLLTPVEKCSLSDSACLKKTAQSFVSKFVKGIPELNVEVLDVMQIDHIKFELAGLILNMKNVEVKGLKSCVINKLSVDMAKKQIQMVYHCDTTLTSKYKAGGRLLILPISGDGDATIKLENMKIDITMLFEIKKDSNGKNVIALSSYKYKYDVKDGAHYLLTNLFNGNKQLSEAMLSFMNQNWKMLTQEFGGPILETMIKKTYSAIKNYLLGQPLDEIINE